MKSFDVLAEWLVIFGINKKTLIRTGIPIIPRLGDEILSIPISMRQHERIGIASEIPWIEMKRQRRSYSAFSAVRRKARSLESRVKGFGVRRSRDCWKRLRLSTISPLEDPSSMLDYSLGTIAFASWTSSSGTSQSLVRLGIARLPSARRDLSWGIEVDHRWSFNRFQDRNFFLKRKEILFSLVTKLLENLMLRAYFVIEVRGCSRSRDAKCLVKTCKPVGKQVLPRGEKTITRGYLAESGDLVVDDDNDNDRAIV